MTATPQQVLACPMDPNNDSGADTVGGYLLKLLAELWERQEEFSGKRPFGNSGWEWDVYAALVKAGLLDGQIVDGYLEDADRDAGERLIRDAIAAAVLTAPSN